MRRVAPVIEALGALTVTLPLAIWLRYPTLWFFVPFVIITLTGRAYEPYGLTLRNPGSLRFHALTTVTVFGGYALLFAAVAHFVLGYRFEPTLPDDVASVLFVQLVVIGLSEEFFFRGYVQTHLNGWLGRPYNFLGARFGWGLILAAIVFGLCHIVTGEFYRMQVVFFGLFAGWLRERTDTIAVPAAYHGVANVLHETLLRSFVR